MIHLSAQSKILLAPAAQDFRKGIDGFAALCRHQLAQAPQSGVLFVFINRTKTMIRILTYEDNGFWLMTKRLSKGRYLHWPQGDQPVAPLQAKQLRLLLQNSVATELMASKEKSLK